MENTIRSLEAKLNNTIDTELEKEITHVDCGLIIECCDGLLRLGSTEKYILSAQQMLANKSALLGTELTGGKKRNRRKTLRTVLIAAVIALLLAVAAFGYAQVKYDILHFSDHSTVLFNGINKKKTVKDLTIGYIPEGFELIDEFNSKKGISKLLKKGNDFFEINKESSKTIDFDTEHGDSRVLKINGIDYIVHGGEGYTGIIWTDSEFVYSLAGSISEKELLKIAMSIS